MRVLLLTGLLLFGCADDGDDDDEGDGDGEMATPAHDAAGGGSRPDGGGIVSLDGGPWWLREGGYISVREGGWWT
ncbi:MAG: hypothetical protein ABW352_04895, partial [Polyangiales bacterium]